MLQDLYNAAAPLALASATVTILIAVISDRDGEIDSILDKQTRIAFLAWFTICILVLSVYALGYLSGGWVK